jgi:PQQ-dependent catabolism-associated CXXCW motif protein
LIQRADAEPKVRSLDDPALQTMRIGAVIQTPPVTLMAREGLLDNMAAYHLTVDTRFESPGRQMVEDLAAGKIDVGVLWGPIAGYWATRQSTPIEIAPLLGENSGVRMDFRISMGLRRNEPEWKQQVNDLIADNQAAIQAILLEYGVPLLDSQGKLIEPAAEETRGDVEPVPEPAGYRMAEYRAPVPVRLTGATTVDTAGLQQLLASGRPILIDVLPASRAPQDRPADRLWRPKPHANLPGSVWLANVGYGELSAEFERYFRDHLARLSAGDTGRQLVFYCQAGCWMSWNAAKRAQSYGYRNVVWYPEGTDGWQATGLPLVPAEPEPMPDFVPLTRPATADARG